MTEEAKGDWQGKETSVFRRQSWSIMQSVTYTGSQFTHNNHLRTTIPLTKLIILATGISEVSQYTQISFLNVKVLKLLGMNEKMGNSHLTYYAKYGVFHY